MTAKIYQVPLQQVGTVQVYPNFKFMVVGDDYGTITTAGYLNNANLEGYTVSPTDVLQILYNYNLVTQTGSFGTFSVSVSDGVITLTLTTTAPSYDIANNDVPIWSTGINTFYDSGITVVDNNISYGYGATFGQAASSSVSVGTLNDNSGSFTAYSGSGDTFIIVCNNTGSSVTTTFASSNTAAQDTNIYFADCGSSSGYAAVSNTDFIVNGQLVQYSPTNAGALIAAGFSLLAGTTATYGGGGTSHGFTVTGVAAGSIAVCTIATSTNAVAIDKVVASTNTLTVTFSADPGAATTVNYIVMTP